MIIVAALWLGILTSISPCPLATNIAAVSFLSKKITHPRMVLFSGAAYTVGRTLAYAIVGYIVVKSSLGVPLVANFLQRYTNITLGPVLIVVGLFLLDVFKFSIPAFNFSAEYQKKLAESGVPGSFSLGFIFALSFCPISAALFFGSLIPLAIKSAFGLWLPFVYGIGTAIPVIVFAIGIALGAVSISRLFHQVTKLEIYARKITGLIFIFVGIYYVCAYILHIL